MGRYLEQYDKDYMRMAMLKQEETFRHQVTELHRLYRVQKVLMNDTKAAAEIRGQMTNSSNSRTKLERWSCRNTDVDNETLASPRRRRQPRYGYSCQLGLQRIRPPFWDLDLELPAEEYIGKDDRDDDDDEEEEECGLELTLATGSKNRRRRRKKENSFTSDSGASFSSSSTEWGGVLLQFPDIRVERNKSSTVRFDVEEEQMREEPPPWLFHCSTLNMA